MTLESKSITLKRLSDTWEGAALFRCLVPGYDDTD
jgi:hypothetical protein